jgi:hypothetical protein
MSFQIPFRAVQPEPRFGLSNEASFRMDVERAFAQLPRLLDDRFSLLGHTHPVTDILAPAGTYLQAGAVILIGADASGFIKVGPVNAADSMIIIPYGAVTFAAAAGRNGGLMVDSANNRLVYYSGGAKYYLAGTAF